MFWIFKKNIDIYDENKKYKKNFKFNDLNDKHKTFILDYKTKSIKDIIDLFHINYKIIIHQKQIIDIMYQNKIFLKSSPTIINFIIKTINYYKITTVKELKDLIFKEYELDKSFQLIYNILKQNGYVYKKFKLNNNLYKIDE
jgi:hypothetical protein